MHHVPMYSRNHSPAPHDDAAVTLSSQRRGVFQRDSLYAMEVMGKRPYVHSPEG